MPTSRPQGGEETPEERLERLREAGRKGGQRSAETRRAKQAAKQARAAAEAAQEAAGADRGEAQGRTAALEIRSSGTDDTRAALVRVPIPVGEIMRQLSADAKGGDTAAARELRAWMTQFPPDDAAADASDLAAPTRARIASILARALAEAEEDLQTEGFEEGTQDANGSPLPASGDSASRGHPRASGSHPSERGSRPLTAIHEAPPPPADANGSHPADGTDEKGSNA